MAWTIKGDADVTVETIGGIVYGLDATERSLSSIRAAASLKLAVLADDVFTYSVKTQNAKGKGVIVPKDRQWISVFNSDGTRIFKGVVAAPTLGLDRLQVSAYGPWKQMSEITLSGRKAGAAEDRSEYVFPEQGLRLSFQSLINRAVDMGVPMKKVLDDEVNTRIDAMFPMMQITLSNMSFAAALGELMGLVGDAVCCFDYSSSPPALYIKRRENMESISYAVGATGQVRVSRADIKPRSDLNVARHELRYVQRSATTGKPVLMKQAAGTADTDEKKRRVLITTISGPENTDHLPLDEFESMVIQTEQVRVSYGWAVRFDATLKGIVEKYGAPDGSPYDGGAIANAHYLKKGEVREWMKRQLGIKQSEVKVGRWISFSEGISGGIGRAGVELKILGRLRRFLTENRYEIFVEYTVPVINVSYPTKQTIYKKLGYQFQKPMAGLAADMRDSRNWTPYEGPVELTRGDELTGYNGLQRKFNLTNAHPDYAGMNALVRSITYDLASHKVTWELGPPTRTALGSLVNKSKRNGRDNIVID